MMNDQSVQTSLLTTAISTTSQTGSWSERWNVFGRKLPKSELVFLSQVLLIYMVVIACIVNLSRGDHSQLWVILLGTCFGVAVPQPQLPTLKRHGKGDAASLE